MFSASQKPLIGTLSSRGGISLLRSKILRASVFAWATLVAVIISNVEAVGMADISVHFIAAVILAPLSTLFTALSAYILNDLSDIDIDSINAPRRPMVTKIVGKSNVVALIALLDSGAVLASSVLGSLSMLIILLEIAGGFAYSYRPFASEGRFVLKTLSIGIAGAISSLFGAVALGFGLSPPVVYGSSIFFLYLFATSPLNDLMDKLGDGTAKRRTIPIVIGDKNTVRLSILASLFPLVSSVVLTVLLHTDLLMSVLLAIVSFRSVQLLVPLLKESRYDSLKNTHRQMVVFHFILQAAILIGSFHFLQL